MKKNQGKSSADPGAGELGSDKIQADGCPNLDHEMTEASDYCFEM